MNLQSISRYISLILRHKPEVIGITIDEHGWANVEELIQGIAKNNPGFNKEFLEEIVRTDNKQRYSFNDDKTLIRANQGHSIPVDVELEEKEPPKILYHGTGEKYIAWKRFFRSSSALCRSSWKRSCNWCTNATGSAERYLCCVQAL